MKRAALLLFLLPSLARADPIDDLVEHELEKRKIPGLSLAIFEGGQIVKARGYGLAAAGGAAVTPATLFQAGSISKPVAALGALLLVDKGTLSLDEDVNRKLRSWKVPANDLQQKRKVTLRGLLSHTAGLTVHGFPGYPTTCRPTTSSSIWAKRGGSSTSISSRTELYARLAAVTAMSTTMSSTSTPMPT